MLGTLHFTDDGRIALRFERRFAHAPEKVWRAITETEHLHAWFPAIVEFDLTPGAKLLFDMTPAAKARFAIPDERDMTSEGEITTVDPPHLLEYTWGDEVLRWEITDDGDGGCRLVFTNTFDDRDGAAAMGAGWHAGLDVLEAHLDGRELGRSVWDQEEQLRERYARSFG
jgi:uncharacterized protein YndB with AHSA1/START domain